MKSWELQRCRGEFPVRLICRGLKLSPSDFYDWSSRKPSARAVDNKGPLRRIRDIHEDLVEEGETADKNWEVRLMAADGLQGWLRRKRRRQRATATAATPFGVRNHLQRDFLAWESETKWVTDITEIATLEGKLWLCVVPDLCSQLTVSWSMHHRQDRQMVIRAIEMAAWKRQRKEQIVLHSDRGAQFRRFDYQRLLTANNLVSSMSAGGHCGDNAACGGSFGVLKRDRANRRRYPTRDTAGADVFNYIEMFHNPRMRRRVAKQDWQYAVFSEPSEKTG